MKSIQSKNITPSNFINGSFFQKENSNNFFGKTSNSFFNPSLIQAKLTVNQPNDKYEEEADSMADKVVQRLATPEPLTQKDTSVQAKALATTITPFIQTKCAACEQEEKIQKKEEEDLVQESSLELQRKPIFESNAEPPDDENNIQRKCADCEQEEEINQTKEDLSNQVGLIHIAPDELIQKDDEPSGSHPATAAPKPAPAKPTKQLKTPIVVNWNFVFPAIPKPDYSLELDALGALEIAKLVLSGTTFTYQVELVDPAKDNSCYLKEVTINFNPVLTYNIAKQLDDLVTTGYTTNPIKGLPLPDTDKIHGCFVRLLSKINVHALHHFDIYKTVAVAFETDFKAEIGKLPSLKKPSPIKKMELENQVNDLVLYHVGLLHWKLWDATCAWEKKDYPKLTEHTCWSGQFKPDCGKAPELPAIQIRAKGGK